MGKCDKLVVDGITYSFNEDYTLDEIVGSGSFHVEQMDDMLWWIGIVPEQAPAQMHSLDFWTPRTRIRLCVRDAGGVGVSGEFGEFGKGKIVDLG